MRREHNKLVRDRIPEIIRQDGRQCEIRVLSEEDYVQALKEKLVEESQEAARADEVGIVRELADLYEVIDAIIAAQSIDRQEILAKQRQRRLTRGAFEERIFLLWTD